MLSLMVMVRGRLGVGFDLGLVLGECQWGWVTLLVGGIRR